ncbi:alpha/beta-hydrolase [Tilletiaria anomala UBC 951]|uniref:Alpha/beta-hydrolase n=1 Tax=Tilletiaria anomala (strain ATCC 24038 / CBS 436.72 / UBC 951) TaxID=1037660 RepID=A0A066WR08_TILAU|nr:alpha/beta-hydrolase [Tilletiaria anomala UBC 951]KDN53080.1 alpha/beta-hydrolase [Tilletiaria anomala UBC 951]
MGANNTILSKPSNAKPRQQLRYYFEPPPPLGTVREIITVPLRHKNRRIKLHVYRPEPLYDGKDYTVSVNFHGSGFVLPCHGQDFHFCAQLCSRLNVVVLDADYRNAPEDPFPAAVEDANDVVPFALPPLDFSRLTLTSFSVGGNLALVTATRLGPQRVAAVSTDVIVLRFEHGQEPAKPNFQIRYQIEERSHSPLQGIIHCQGKRSLSCRVVHIICGDGDILWDDSDKLINKLKSANHPDATLNTVKHGGHAFDKAQRSPDGIKPRDYAYDVVFAAVERGHNHA